MRLWHQKLIPHLPRQQLLGQHRELCALRGKGWGRPHATVNYVFTHSPSLLVAYHHLIMNEMERRGYHPDPIWRDPNYRGKVLGYDVSWANDYNQYLNEEIIYPEHDDKYLEECLNLLKEKGAPIDYGKI